MSTPRVLLLVLLCSAFASLSGAAAGYYAALATPTSSSIAILDIESAASQVDPNSPNAAGQVQALAEQAKAVTKKLTDAGIVVIDRANVIGAPEDAVIHIQAPAR